MADVNSAALPGEEKSAKEQVQKDLSNDVEAGILAPAKEEGSNCLKRTLEANNDADGGEVKKPRIPKKKKVAMLLSYCGQGYLGMQNNQPFKTIEGDLFEAFKKVGIMDEESYKVPQTIQFQRAARTDKGVR